MSRSKDLRRLMARRATDAGLVAAAAGVPDGFQRTLTSRSNLDQAIVSGLTFVIEQGVVSTIQETIQSLALRVANEGSGLDPRTWSRFSLGADGVAVAVGLGLQSALRQTEQESTARAVGRTGGRFLSLAGISGVVAGGVHEAAEAGRSPTSRSSRIGLVVAAGSAAAVGEYRRRRRERLDESGHSEETEISAVRSLVLGVAVSIGATGMGRAEGWFSCRVSDVLSRVLPGDELIWRPVGHLAALGLFALGGRAGAQVVFRRIEGGQFGFEAALDVPPLEREVSGSSASIVPYPTMAKMGRRMVWTLRRPEEIGRVMDENAVAHPVRIYGGLALADTPAERVSIALDDLERAGGFDRSWLMLVSPTGTGYVNYAAVGALEFLTKGDCATVALQYSARPSPISLDRVNEGREQFRLLVDAVMSRLSTRGSVPRIVIFGESLGAWTSQDAFLHRGTEGLVEVGVDHAVWIGTPYESKWKSQVLKEDRSDVDRSLVGVFNDIGEWDALDDETRAGIRYVMVTHHNDGVALFGASLLVRQPDWLGDPAERPPGVPRSQRWIPVTTFVQTLIDMKNAARVVPGVFEADGHDYRADLPPFLRAVLGLEATSEQLERITLALEAEEALRTEWLTRHGSTGQGMANELLRRIRDAAPEVYEAAFAELRDDMRARQEVWESNRRS